MRKPGQSDRCCSCCTPIVTAILLVVFGVILIIAGGILIPVFDNLVHEGVKEQIPIENGSKAYTNWLSPKSPVIMRYYMFDVQNRDDVMEGKTPILKERGPYSYREVRQNLPTSFSNSGNKLTYLGNVDYHFDTEDSCANCTEDDIIMTPNVAIMTLAATVESMSAAMRLGASFVIDASNGHLFHPLRVKEIIWGYNDTTLEYLLSWKKKFPALPIPDLSAWVALQINGTAGALATGTLTILTGKNDSSRVQELISWRGNSTLHFWKTKYANMINGSDGTHFRPFTRKTDVPYLFVTNLCRSLYLVFDEETSVRSINAYRFTTDEYLFANYSVNKDNIGYCVPKCYASGLLPIGHCIPMNPPVLMSAPHFYLGDPKLWQAFVGLKPERDKHATFVDVEPLTGITVRAYKRLQINLLIKKIPEIRILDKVNELAFPVLYLEEYAMISKSDANTLKSAVYTPILVTEAVQYLLIALGGALVIAGILVAVCRRTKYTTGSLLINESNEDDGRHRTLST